MPTRKSKAVAVRKGLLDGRSTGGPLASPPKNQLPGLPLEILDEIFSYFPEDLIVTPRGRPVHSSPYHPRRFQYRAPDGIVAINSKRWCKLLRLEEVCKKFSLMIVRSVEFAISTKKVQLTMDIMNTTYLEARPGEGQPFPATVIPPGSKVAVIPDYVPAKFPRILLISYYAVLTWTPPCEGVSIKRLEVAVGKSNEDGPLRLGSPIWTSSMMSCQNKIQDFGTLKFRREEYLFGPMFDVIISDLRAVLDNSMAPNYLNCDSLSTGHLLDFYWRIAVGLVEARVEHRKLFPQQTNIMSTPMMLCLKRIIQGKGSKPGPVDPWQGSSAGVRSRRQWTALQEKGESFLTKWRRCMEEMKLMVEQDKKWGGSE